MKMKNENAKWIPPLKACQEAGTNQHGFIDLNGEIWTITDLHHYADYGTTLETLTITNGKEIKEIYSQDECETFTLELQEA
jgi:hypothetical protein